MYYTTNRNHYNIVFPTSETMKEYTCVSSALEKMPIYKMLGKNAQQNFVKSYLNLIKLIYESNLNIVSVFVYISPRQINFHVQTGRDTFFRF